MPPCRRNHRRRHRPDDREPAEPASYLGPGQPWRAGRRPGRRGNLVAGRRRAPAGRRHREGFDRARPGHDVRHHREGPGRPGQG
ncbi:hypothetical protein G6F57_022083 [Rhizopus arrhizus]|nr:hypothetical protein G6F57_022083 [Rhizopus arrhizus]